MSSQNLKSKVIENSQEVKSFLPKRHTRDIGLHLDKTLDLKLIPVRPWLWEGIEQSLHVAGMWQGQRLDCDRSFSMYDHVYSIVCSLILRRLYLPFFMHLSRPFDSQPVEYNRRNVIWIPRLVRQSLSSCCLSMFTLVVRTFLVTMWWRHTDHLSKTYKHSGWQY